MSGAGGTLLGGFDVESNDGEGGLGTDERLWRGLNDGCCEGNYKIHAKLGPEDKHDGQKAHRGSRYASFM